MPRDLQEEQLNIDLSRLQRATLERYVLACLNVGELNAAEDCRQALLAQSEPVRQFEAA